jgi:hypothetical protein
LVRRPVMHFILEAPGPPTTTNVNMDNEVHSPSYTLQ